MPGHRCRNGAPGRFSAIADGNAPSIDIRARGHLLWLLKGAFHYARRAVDDAIRQHGITTSQLGVLNRLIEQPGLSGAELARENRITPQAAQLALTTLERKRLVRRKPDPDHGRILRAVVTPSGRKLTEKCMIDALEAEEQLVSLFTPQERQTLTDLLVRLLDDAPDVRRDGAPDNGA
jgi:DNA-binding MarR family transcriptional regulator